MKRYSPKTSLSFSLWLGVPLFTCLCTHEFAKSYQKDTEIEVYSHTVSAPKVSRVSATFVFESPGERKTRQKIELKLDADLYIEPPRQYKQHEK